MSDNVVRRWLPLRSNELGLIAAIVVVVLLTATIDTGHAYWSNPQESFVDIARQTALLGMVALGAAVAIISGGIDLSAGSMITFSATIFGSILVVLAPEAMDSARSGADGSVQSLSTSVIAAAMAGTLLVGFLVGTLHAWLITSVGLPPFIATLATLVGLRSLARALCFNVTEVMLGARSTQFNLLDVDFRDSFKNVWISFGVFAAVALLVWLMLSRTVVGRHLYALGGNEQAARLSGIRTDRVKWLAYCISAMASSVAGFFYFIETGGVDPATLGLGVELNAIAACVVGGCSLQGGIGTVAGTVLGVLFLRCVLDGIGKIIKTGSDIYEGLVVGVVVVVAVAFSQLRQSGRGGKRFFPGVLGLAAVVTLSLLIGALAMVMSPAEASLAYGRNALVFSLAVLGALKAWESFGRRG